MTERQLEVLRKVRDHMRTGGKWEDLFFSPPQGTGELTWEEGTEFMVPFERAAILSRIDAALIVSDAVNAKRGEDGRRSLEGDVGQVECVNDWPPARCMR